MRTIARRLSELDIDTCVRSYRCTRTYTLSLLYVLRRRVRQNVHKILSHLSTSPSSASPAATTVGRFGRSDGRQPGGVVRRRRRSCCISVRACVWETQEAAMTSLTLTRTSHCKHVMRLHVCESTHASTSSHQPELRTGIHYLLSFTLSHPLCDAYSMSRYVPSLCISLHCSPALHTLDECCNRSSFALSNGVAPKPDDEFGRPVDETGLGIDSGRSES